MNAKVPKRKVCLNQARYLKRSDVGLFPFQINFLYAMFRKSGKKFKQKERKKWIRIAHGVRHDRQTDRC